MYFIYLKKISDEKMSLFSRLFGLVKDLGILILFVSIVVPIRYGSINPQYISSRPTLSGDYLAFE